VYSIVIDNTEGALSPAHGPHCTRKQARELLEGLRTVYQSLLPAERILIRGTVAQSARTQFTREVSAEDEGLVC